MTEDAFIKVYSIKIMIVGWYQFAQVVSIVMKTKFLEIS